MPENRKDRDRRFYFSRGQLVLLGGAFVLASLMIFLLGIVVGRGIEERKMARPEEPLIKVPINPSARGGPGNPVGQTKEELTFYDTLGQSSNAELALQGKARGPKHPDDVKESKAKPRETASPGSLQAAEKPHREKSQAGQVANSPGEPVPAWYVQVNAFPDEKSGQTFVEKLKNKGYNAYLSEGRNQGKVWYRVRVGEFSSREEAERIAEILKSKENFPKAFATRQ